jgi:hypothetical protein
MGNENALKSKTKILRLWGSSGSIVFNYRLDDRGSIPDRSKGFFL